MGKRVINNDMRLDGGRWVEGGGGAAQGEGRRASAEVTLEAPGETGSPAQRGKRWRTPPNAPLQGFVRAGGGAASSTEEGADLQGFTYIRANLLE